MSMDTDDIFQMLHINKAGKVKNQFPASSQQCQLMFVNCLNVKLRLHK